MMKKKPLPLLTSLWFPIWNTDGHINMHKHTQCTYSISIIIISISIYKHYFNYTEHYEPINLNFKIKIYLLF